MSDGTKMLAGERHGPCRLAPRAREAATPQSPTSTEIVSVILESVLKQRGLGGILRT